MWLILWLVSMWANPAPAALVPMAEYKPDICAYCQAATWCEQRANGKPQCRACKVEKFFENVLYPPLGLKLLAWQRKELRAIYGTVRPENGRRQYTRVLIEVPKKNGKSFLIGGLPIYHLLMESTEIRPAAFGAASAKEQAGLVYGAAATLVRANPELRSRLRILDSVKKIVRRDGGGSYSVISADGAINDGIEPSLAIVDELHRWKGERAAALLTVMTKGMISRKEELLVQITTYGAENESPLWLEEHETAVQKLKGEIDAPRLYYSSYGADAKRVDSDAEPDYWKSREARVQANPSHEDHGGFLLDEKIVDELAKALKNPVKRAEYLRYHLNVKVTSTQENAIDMPAWRACGGEVDLRTWPVFGPDELRLLISKWKLIDKPCYAGVDAAWTTDMTGLSLVFPPFDGCAVWTVLPFAFFPELRIPELMRKTRRNEIAQWAHQGFIETTPGNAVDASAIKVRLRWAREMFELREVAFDPWNFRTSASELNDEGFECVEVPQNFGHLSEATKKVLEIYTTGDLRHGNHPVLNWHASCLALQGDRKDNVQPAKPERGRSANRIDLMSALVTAMNRALTAEDNTISSTEVWSVG